MSSPPIYVRVKRRNQTFCFLCQESETVSDIKTKIQDVLKQHPVDGGNPIDLQFLDPETSDVVALEDPLKDGLLLHAVFAVADNEFETVDVVSTDVQES